MRNHIRKKVRQLIRKYRTQSPEKLAEALNILVIYTPLDKVWGIYDYTEKTRVILINSNLSEIVRRFVLAHEIGHAVLHTKTTCYCHKSTINSLKTEREANVFASELLLHEFDESLLYEYTLEQVASMNYVPLELLEIKLLP